MAKRGPKGRASGQGGLMASALETPMMKQFLAIKARYPDSIVFYRMGDFYEMFLADAELAAPLLDIATLFLDSLYIPLFWHAINKNGINIYLIRIIIDPQSH